jgi:predicted mannosyl-3-phosphoglycerate phosphatase (HAD superfamily)
MGEFQMCDYSLHSIKSRLAKIGDKLTTLNFGTGTRGFAASEDATIAVCVLPRTELSFSTEVTYQSTSLFCWRNKAMTTAIFRQVNKQRLAAHHGRADANNRNHRDGADHPSSGTVGYTPRDRDEADHRTWLRREYLCAAAAL